MKILITGINGFIGSHLASAFAQRGDEVSGMVRAKSCRSELDAIKDQLDLHEGKIEDANEVAEIFAATQPDVVYHLAASGVKAAGRDWKKNIDANVLGTWNVIEACRGQPSVRRLIYTKTCLEDQLATSPAFAANPYVASKFLATHLVTEAAGRTQTFVSVVATLFSVYGKGDDSGNVIPYVINQLRAGKVAELGSGRGIRDWIYIDDAVEGLVELVQDRYRQSSYHIGTGKGRTVREIIEIIGRYLHQPDRLHFNDAWDRGDEVAATVADPKKFVPGVRAPRQFEDSLSCLITPETALQMR